LIPLTAALILEKQSVRAQLLEVLKGIPVRIVLDQGGFGAWHLVQERLERLQPDVVLVDLGEEVEERFGYIQKVRMLARPPAIMVIHSANDAQLILSAMRAGAAEFLTLPLAQAALEAALERISALAPERRAGTETGGKLLAFLAAKGGAGATTLACNVAVGLARSTGKEALLADLDLETGNVAFAMKTSSQYNILDACRNISRLDAHFWRGLVSNGLPGLNILTAPADLRGLDAPQAVEIRQVLRFARTVYDFSLVDLASSLNRLTLAVLEDADQAFLVSTSDLPSLHLAKRVLQTLLQTGYGRERVRLLVNRCSRRDQVTPEDIERNLGVPVYWSFPEDSDSVGEFYVKGGAIAPQSDLGKSIRRFVQQISPPPAEKKKKSFLGF